MWMLSEENHCYFRYADVVKDYCFMFARHHRSCKKNMFCYVVFILIWRKIAEYMQK